MRRREKERKEWEAWEEREEWVVETKEQKLKEGKDFSTHFIYETFPFPYGLVTCNLYRSSALSDTSFCRSTRE